MTTSHRARAAVLAAVCTLSLAAFAPQPADADRLVLRDGSEVETRGPWTERGRLIVFQAADGKLASLKADQVDLAASRRATEAAAAKPEVVPTRPPDPPKRKAARVITNADIPPGRPAPDDQGATAGEGVAAEGAAAEPDATADTPPTAAPRPQASPVVVDGWEQVDGPDGVILRGRLRNGAEDRTAAAIRLEVVLFDREGKRLVENRAEVRPTTLPAGEAGEFEVSFPGVYDLSAVRFDLESTDLRQTRGEPSGSITRRGGSDDSGS